MIGYNDPPGGFPARAITNETPPRELIVLGTSGIDPDVWVARFATDAPQSRAVWIVKGSGGLCHESANVLRDRVTAWVSEPEYDDGGGAVLSVLYAQT